MSSSSTQALAGADGAYRLVDPLGPLGAAEFRIDIALPHHALGGHAGIELKGAPAHRHLGLRAGAERPGEPALADKAPGADRIREDVEMHANAMVMEAGGTRGAKR